MIEVHHTPTQRRRGFLEICVDSLAGARAALAGGADQIELCSALALGGLTPSAGLVEAVLAVARPAGVAVRAMVRPRPGDFTYGTDDFSVAVAEGRALVAAGVDGLVFGLARDRQLDIAALRAWRDAVAAPRLTLHRAIDLVVDPVAAVDAAIALEIDQILSSGGAPSAVQGLVTLSAMADRAGGRCRIVAGAGVRPENVGAFRAAGLRALHASARAETAAGNAELPESLGFGTAPPPADIESVRRLRHAIDMLDDRTNNSNWT